jgi:hypothetical protein
MRKVVFLLVDSGQNVVARALVASNKTFLALELTTFDDAATLWLVDVLKGTI